MALKLSILIATIPSRELQLGDLLDCLNKQGGSVEILTDGELGYNIGRKRNELLKLAQGEYIVYIDDDDIVSDRYVSLILTAVESNPDCIGTSGIITTDGGNPMQWHISREYSGWYEQDGIYYRTPNHISPVRRELALATGFKEVSTGEDFDYSMRLLPLLKTEVRIPENIYSYNYWNKTHV